MKRSLISITFALFAAFLPQIGAQSEELRSRAAAAFGVPIDRIEVGEPGRRIDAGGKTIEVLKVRDILTDRETTLGFDAAGRVTAVDAITRGSKRSPLLSQAFAEANGAPVEIGIWLAFDAERVDQTRFVDEQLAAGFAIDDAKAAARERVAAVNSEIVGAARVLLESRGFVVRYADRYAPVISTSVNAEDLAEIEELSIVEMIYPSLTYRGELDSSVPTHRWDRVHQFGVRGIGVKVAVCENNGISDTHPDLDVKGWFNANHNVGSHPTAVAGILGADDTTYPGHARGVDLYSGNSNSWLDPDLMAAASWAIGQGCDIINMSYGFETGNVMALLDRYVDYQVRYNFTLIVKSAGNEGAGTGSSTSPGLGWNVLSVGNFMDGGDADWTNDAMNPGSSFENPVSANGDRQKPEIAAVGTSLTTSDIANGYSAQGSGTSYAAPAVAGMAACFMQMQPVMKTRPELVRAVMMAGATHNLEGSSRLSDKDGAGGVNGLNAFKIVERGRLYYGSIVASDVTGGNYQTFNIYLRGGDRTRVVYAWNSRASSSFSTDVLDADLDMRIFAGLGVTSGVSITSSATYDNSYEIVEFVPAATGWYTVRINAFAFAGTSERYGMAWTQHEDARYVRFRENLPDAVSTDLCGPVIGNPNYDLYPYDPHNPNDLVVVFASATDTFGLPLADGRLVYADFDLLSNYSMTPGNPNFLNYVGTYDAVGHYDAYQLNIPDNPAYVGYPVFFTAVTLEAGSPGAIKEISETKEIALLPHATTLAVGNNGVALVNLPFSFPFYGQSYTQMWVNANGNITFGTWSTDSSESSTDLSNGPPRIAPLWDDIDPASGGLVRVRSIGDQTIVEWVNCPEAGTSAGENSVRVVLRSNGRIEFQYKDCTIDDCIVGISPGGGAVVDAINITDGWYFGATGQGLYQSFFMSGLFNIPFDLGTPTGIFASLFYYERNTVRFTPTGIGANSYRVTIDY